VYAPRVSEDEFMRIAVRQQSAVSTTRPPATGGDQARVEQALAYLGILHSENDQRIDDAVLQTIAALLERAETAERAAATWEARARHAEIQIQAVEQRAMAAKTRAEQAERRVQTLLQQMNRPPKLERKPPVPFQTVIEHRDGAGICRVCGKKAPPQSAARRDDLRVCVAEACREEARRRDNAAKQRRARARRRARR
jgi:anti-sigma factor ChrR (cupin superfamily)